MSGCVDRYSTTDPDESSSFFEGLALAPIEMGVAGVAEADVASPGPGKTANAFTPSSFAQLDVEDGDAPEVAQEELSQAIESVGDTVRLPELDQIVMDDDGQDSSDLTIGKRIFRFMVAAAKGKGSSRTRNSVGTSESNASTPWKGSTHEADAATPWISGSSLSYQQG